jgi:hypothetical protein
MMSEIVTLDEDQDGNLVLPFSDKVLSAVGWNEGDTINWQDNGDGTFTLKKVEPRVLVEVQTVQVVRHMYYIETPADHIEYALDDVTCNDAPLHSKKYLDEVIVSHRVVAKIPNVE